MNKQFLSAIALTAGLSVAGAANAQVILPGGIAVLEDDNIEYVLDANGEIKTSGTLQQGDTLVAFIGFDETQDGSSNTVQDLGAPGQELTGISAITVTSIVGDIATFGPSGLLGDYTTEANAMAVLFEQSVGDFSTSCHSAGINDCEDAATNGDHWLTVGFGDADDFWIAEGALPGIDLSVTTLDLILATAAGTKAAVANYSLSILENGSDYTFEQQFNPLSAFYALGGGDDGLVDIIGSGDVLGGSGLENDFIARSDFDFQLDRVPAPATLGLIGVGLIGLRFFSRRKKA